jgi:hypothetical protein
MFHLVLVWIVVTSLLFGTTFWVDRGGWIWFRMTGYNVTISEDRSHARDMSVPDFLRRNPEFEVTQAGTHELTLRGTHVFDRTIIVPRGTTLVIEPGSELRFGAGSSMISYGAVRASGTREEPIRFTANRALLKWGSIGVVGNGAGGSVFEHTYFEHGRQAKVNGIDFRGCLSIIGGEVTIRHSSFTQLFGKDAVYVLDGSVNIHDNFFKDTFKDGLDLDGGRGTVHQNRFVDCGDEGIDLSQNEHIQVYDNVIVDERGGRFGADQKVDEIRTRNRFGHSGSDEKGIHTNIGHGATP